MSFDKISHLLSLMKEYDIVELELEEGDFSVALRKQGAFLAQCPPPTAPSLPFAPQPQSQAQPAPAIAAPVLAAGLHEIKSPIVGTIYHAPSPEARPFVDTGAKVNKDTVVCLVEAMKIMNEVKAEVEGVIEKVLVESGEPVEYGQPLFLVKRAGA